jgi:hypothetical protein
MDLIPEGATLRDPDGDNLEPLTDEEAGRGHLSHSSIGTMLACKRRWGWHYDEGLELIERPAYLSMGSAFAGALQLRDPIAGANQMDRPTYDQDDYDTLLKNKAIVASAAAAYLGRWGRAEGHTSELAYRIRIRSPYTGAYSRTFDLVGRADGVVDHGEYLTMEEDKLVGRIDATTVKKTALDRQLSLGCYALWRVTGKPVRTVRKRWTKKPSIKQKQNETVAEYIARLEQDYIDRRDDFYTHEEETFRSDADLLLTECEIWEWAEELRASKRSRLFPRNTSSCSDFGGCAFIPLCSGDPDARSLYRVRETVVEEEAA